VKSRSEVEVIVDRILSTILQIDSTSLSGSAREVTPSWTSLIHIEIFFVLEEEFDIRFDEDSMAFAESRNDLVDAVLEALS
jgi:acyl carrier protein